MDWHLQHLPRKLSRPLPVLRAAGQYMSEGADTSELCDRNAQIQQHGDSQFTQAESMADSAVCAILHTILASCIHYRPKCRALSACDKARAVVAFKDLDHDAVPGTNIITESSWYNFCCFDSHRMHSSTHTRVDRPSESCSL